jgi:hypothetical protein
LRKKYPILFDLSGVDVEREDDTAEVQGEEPGGADELQESAVLARQVDLR